MYTVVRRRSSHRKKYKEKELDLTLLHFAFSWKIAIIFIFHSFSQSAIIVRNGLKAQHGIHIEYRSIHPSTLWLRPTRWNNYMDSVTMYFINKRVVLVMKGCFSFCILFCSALWHTERIWNGLFLRFVLLVLLTIKGKQ